MVLHLLRGGALRAVIEAVSFDFYNTLVFPHSGRGRGAVLTEYLAALGLESKPWVHQYLYDIFDRHDVDYSPRGDADRRRRYLRDLARRVFQVLEVEAPRRRADAHADEFWRILGPEAFGVFADARPVLAALRERGYRIALVSNWQRGLSHFVEELGLGSAFDHVLSSAEVGLAKPDARIFAEACTRLGAAPERVLHIGDTLADDYEGARGAGLAALMIHRAPDAPPAGVEAIAGLGHLLERLPAA